MLVTDWYKLYRLVFTSGRLGRLSKSNRILGTFGDTNIKLNNMNSKNDNEIRYNILKKYFEDRASDEEKKLLDKWLNNDERTNEWETT